MFSLRTYPRIYETFEGASGLLHAQALNNNRRAARPSNTVCPVVAISRQAGVNAQGIADRLGRLLGWKVYNRELIQRVASQINRDPAQVAAVDEKSKNWFTEVMENLFSETTINEHQYVRHLLEVLWSITSKESCVVIGRGAAQALPPASTLRVYLAAPMQDRVRSAVANYGMKRDEAERWITQTDAERRQFVKDHFLKDPWDPACYDIVLNPFRFGEEGTANVLFGAAKALVR